MNPQLTNSIVAIQKNFKEYLRRVMKFFRIFLPEIIGRITHKFSEENSLISSKDIFFQNGGIFGKKIASQ